MARELFAKAQRLGHALVQMAQSRGDASWTHSIDAFFQQAARGSAWYAYATSVCVRAILESGAADPHHTVVRDAFATLAGLERTMSDGTVTWLDPTRPQGDKDVIGKTATAAGEANWYAAVSLHGRIPERGEATAASVHAVAMAYSALRRALGRSDPRAAFESNTAHYPGCPFQTLRLRRDGESTLVNLVNAAQNYQETTPVSPGTAEVLTALAQLNGAATVETILWQIRAESKGMPALQTPDAVRSRINQTNRFFGIEVIRQSAKRYRDDAGRAMSWSAKSSPQMRASGQRSPVETCARRQGLGRPTAAPHSWGGLSAEARVVARRRPSSGRFCCHLSFRCMASMISAAMARNLAPPTSRASIGLGSLTNGRLALPRLDFACLLALASPLREHECKRRIRTPGLH